LVLTTSAEVAVVSVDPATSAGSLFQTLYPDTTLAQFGPWEGLERLRSLLTLLPEDAVSAKTSPTRTEECLLLALIWSVHEQRERSGADSGSDPAVSSALGILERELARRLSVTGLAKRVGLSRSAFVRRFSAALGLPPEKYLTWLRLRRAAELLVSSDAGLAAIASEVGYGSEFSFSRAFRRWYGVAPSSYRKQPSSVVPRTFALAA
jgi:AraC-like DNA-binding protein